MRYSRILKGNQSAEIQAFFLQFRRKLRRAKTQLFPRLKQLIQGTWQIEDRNRPLKA